MNGICHDVVIAGLLFLSVTSVAPADTRNQVSELDTLRASVKVLESQVRDLSAQNKKLRSKLNEVRTRCTELEALCRRNGIELPKGRSETQPAKPEKPKVRMYMYRGRPRTERWFDQQYKRFRDQIVLVDGEYIDIGKAQLQPSSIRTGSPKRKGSYRTAPGGCEVFDVINDREILVIRPGRKARYTGSTSGLGGMWGRMAAAAASTPQLLFHVKGLSIKTLAKGDKFSGKLLYIGSYSYPTARGAKKTVQSYIPYRPVTREQFAEALSQGFELIYYRLITKRKVLRRGSPSGSTGTVEKSITAIKVP